MKHLEYSFLSWPYFALILLVAIVIVYFTHKTHIFTPQSWKSSIRYHMFFYVMLSIVIVAFILVRPFPNSIFFLVIGSLFYKNLVSYSRSIFSLYFSGIKMGDRIKIGKTSGVLTNINFGGIHVLSNHHKVFFAFNQWEIDRIVLESHEGRVPVYIECKDSQGRSFKVMSKELEKSLFEFPYLDPSELIIDRTANGGNITVGIANLQYKDSLLGQIKNAGFEISSNHKKN
ncbi:MAG: hypothetical protein V3V14_03635 [Saprospiraceae bacterium]